MAELPALILLAVVAYFGWKIYSGYRDGPDARSPKQKVPAAPRAHIAAHHWENNGYREVEVVGESNYQPHLKRLVGTPDENGVAVACKAFLIPEPANQYDRNAIRVDIDGGTVGYLAKANAALFHQRLKDHGVAGATTSCPAVIFGGKKMDRVRTPYGVWLEMKRL
ncbi:hypothetical protein IP91_02590 [Pseudoduganella lurida]|uniref:HIRAN domain-containing protein n=1 Tax=Pseudoduganella lurida TaxID=1036180 RepID=A0A562R8I0_9BURK|nr:HIRAN domain-containing protein [Pseudoduganella lurida]TWI65183.1 hypothetical protein IP91_02590 [Pseudoduganella lurida]